MNLMTIEERLDIVKKAYYGEGIQERVLYVVDAPWRPWRLTWDFGSYEYRVKREESLPEMEPLVNGECWMSRHCMVKEIPWFKGGALYRTREEAQADDYWPEGKFSVVRLAVVEEILIVKQEETEDG